MLEDRRSHGRAQRLGHALGVVQALQSTGHARRLIALELQQTDELDRLDEHRRGDHRTGQAATAGLIGAGDQIAALGIGEHERRCPLAGLRTATLDGSRLGRARGACRRLLGPGCRHERLAYRPPMRLGGQ